MRTRLRLGPSVSIAMSVLAVSAGHYATSAHAMVLHEVLTRLYYLPIVWAALVGGSVAGLATAALASVLYVPHVLLGWHGWPTIQVAQYGELVVFFLVAVVSGRIGTRLREERDRASAASEQREEALRRLESSMQERLQVDRWVITGQLATGLAHELRNPLAAARGALDILEQSSPSRERCAEFYGIAQRGIAQAATLVEDLLDFARPGPPANLVVDLRDVLRQALRLTSGAFASRDVGLDLSESEGPALVAVDVAQVQRALVAVLLEAVLALGARRVALTVLADAQRATLTIRLHGLRDGLGRVDSLFEPFTDPRVGHGLAMALAKRFVENQRGTAHAAPCPGGILVVMSLPIADASRRPRLPQTDTSRVTAASA